MGTERDRQIGAAAARIRQSRDMSQQAVAEGMRARDPEHRWSQATVWAVERGDRALKVSELHDFAKVLQTGTRYFTDPGDGAVALRELIEEYHPLDRWARQLDQLVADWEDTLQRLKNKVRATEVNINTGQFAGDENLTRLKVEVEYANEVVAASEKFFAGLKAAIGEGGNAAVRERVLGLNEVTR